MAVSVNYYRNYDASDTTAGLWRSVGTYYEEPSIDYFSWVPPDGYAFKEWNTERDGSGTASHPGEEVAGSVRYAIWEQIPDPVPYLVTDVELTTVADAIREKGGTSAALEWPSGFAQAIADIPSGSGSAHIFADVSTGGQVLYTDANGNVQSEVVDSEYGTVTVDDDAMLGSIVIIYNAMVPPGAPDGTTLIATISTKMGAITSAFQVTG